MSRRSERDLDADEFGRLFTEGAAWPEEAALSRAATHVGSTAVQAGAVGGLARASAAGLAGRYASELSLVIALLFSVNVPRFAGAAVHRMVADAQRVRRTIVLSVVAERACHLIRWLPRRRRRRTISRRCPRVKTSLWPFGYVVATQPPTALFDCANDALVCRFRTSYRPPIRSTVRRARSIRSEPIRPPAPAPPSGRGRACVDAAGASA